MKILKTLLSIILPVLMVTGIAHATSFWQHSVDTGEPYITYEERVNIAIEADILDYTGTPNQNDQLYDFIFNKVLSMLS